MPLTGIVYPDQLTMLTKVLDDYCLGRDILADTAEHEEVARLVGALYQGGTKGPEALKAALVKATTH